MKNILRKLLFSLIFVSIFFVLCGTAMAADGDLISMTLKDLNSPSGTVGKIDSVDVVVAYANAGGEGAACTAIANGTDYATTLTKWSGTGTGAVTVQAIDWVSGSAGVSCTFRVKFDDSDTDLAVDTSATALNVVYDGSTTDLRVTDGAAHTVNVASIASGATEADGAAPAVKLFTYQDNDNDGKIDQFLVTFSETVTGTSVLKANDLNLSSVGDFTDAAFGTNTTDLITDSVSSVTVVLGTESSAEDTAQSAAMQIASQNAFSLTDGTNTNSTLTSLVQSPTFVADGAAPYIKSLSINDTNNDGKINQATFAISENLSDTAAGTNGFDVTSAANHGTCNTESADPAADNTLYLTFTCSSVYTAVGDINIAFTTNAGIKDSSNNQAITKTFTAASTPAIGDNSALPIITSIVFGQDGTTSRNEITFSFSEPMCISTNGTGGCEVTSGQSTVSAADFGNIDAAGSIETLGNFATAGNVDESGDTVNTWTIASGGLTITVDFADTTGSYLTSASTTAPSGAFTPDTFTYYFVSVANAGQPSSAMNGAVTPTPSGSWDLTKPTITSVTVNDASGNNGKLDQATVVFNSAVRDSSITAANATLGGLTGSITTGTANDATTTFNLTSDAAQGIDTSATGAAASFLYSGATTLITDLAGNLLDTTTDGTIVVADVTETDGAAPIVVSVSQNRGGVRNMLTITYSEPMRYNPNGGATWYTNANEGIGQPSTTTLGAMTTAGTVAGFGSWAGGTVGNVANNAATNNTISIQSGDTTMEIIFNDSGYYTLTSTTAPAANNTFTPASAATYLKEQATGGQGVNTSGTVASAPSIVTAWDLTKPTILSAVLTDTGGSNDGKIDTLTLTASETLEGVASSADTIDDWTITAGAQYGSNITVISASATSFVPTYTIVFSGANVYYDTALFTLAAAADEWSLKDTAGNIFAPTSKVCMTGYSCTGGAGNYAVIVLSITAPSSSGGDTVAPAKPTNITATQTTEGKVQLLWTAPTATDLSYTVILRGKNGAAVTGVPYANVLKGTATYTDTDITFGDSVEYILKAVDKSNNASGITDVVKITLVAPVTEKVTEKAVAEEKVVTEEETATEEVEEEKVTEGEEATEGEEGQEVAPSQASGSSVVEEISVNEVVKVFEDVKNAQWAAPAVASLYNRGIIKGKAEGVFAPSDNLNRAETAAMLYRVFEGDEPDAPGSNPFTDVVKSDWYAGYIAKLKAEDIVKGNPDGTYAPSKEINRAEFLALVMRVYEAQATDEELAALDEFPETTTHYADLATSWYTATVAKATQLGIVEGAKVGNKYYFNANATINRAEAAQMIYKAFYASEDEISHTLSQAYASVFGDLPTVLPAIVVLVSMGSVVGFIRLRKKA